MRLKVIGNNLCNLTEQNMCHSGLSHPYITPTAASNVAANTTVKDILKSNPYIVFVSTPNVPDGRFERIEKEPEEPCLCKRLFLD